MGTQSTLSSLSHPATATLFRPQLEPTLRAGALPVLHHLARHNLQHMQYSASKKRQIWSEIVRELMFGAEGRLLTAVGTTTTSPLMLEGVRKVLWYFWTSLATCWGCCVTLREVLLPILQQTFPMEGEASNCRGSRQTVPNDVSMYHKGGATPFDRWPGAGCGAWACAWGCPCKIARALETKGRRKLSLCENIGMLSLNDI